MCLLDGVPDWDETRIVATASGHRRPNHPLRRDEGLSVLCGVEYAAQAAAIHGSLLAGKREGPAKPGYLAAVRELELAVDRLDELESELVIRAEILHGNETGLLYAFAVESKGDLLLVGRVSVFLPG
jgi:predicted hotdog family 3-hydroxylacyl-ACP dehydratase